MKTLIKHLLLTALTLYICSANAQTINWASLKEENKHIVNINAGMEHGVVFGLGYGYKFKTKLFPIVANLEYSFPSGNKIVDDFKTKIGVQVRWIEFHNFQFSTKIHCVFRRYENNFVRLVNFGSDFSGAVGYYRPKWFVAGEVGFDKAIITHFKHSEMYKGQYSGVLDGWYEPATGGNFYYGMQAGFSFKRHDIYLRAGKILTQDFKTAPTIPFYGQLGYNLKI
ncbi:MAG: hypothetical protein AB7G44_01860 [Bacteroidia bacterium]